MCDLRFSVMQEVKKLDRDQIENLMFEVLAKLNLDEQNQVTKLAQEYFSCIHWTKNGDCCIICGKHVPKEKNDPK